MVSLTYHNPTEIRFGVGQIASLDELVPKDASVLLLYGGGSIKKNGVYEQVIAALKSRKRIEFGGVEPNPHYETLQRASLLARASACDFVLGVGGGSVIDAAKFLSLMIASQSDDAWDELVGDASNIVPIPNGAVLTLPATGSESNPVSVISSVERHLKLPFSYQAARPCFAILDPSIMQSLSRRQLENGVVDAFTHVLEQYLTVETNTPIQMGFSEAIMETLITWGPKLVQNQTIEACENVMWAANQALNGLIGAGAKQDWSTHMIGHAITALYGVDHARSLTMIMPSLLRYKMDQKLSMLVRYGKRVWGLSGDDHAIAAAAIDATARFMADMGCPVRISDAGIYVSSDDLVDHLERAGQTKLGEHGDITLNDVREILSMSA